MELCVPLQPLPPDDVFRLREFLALPSELQNEILSKRVSISTMQTVWGCDYGEAARRMLVAISTFKKLATS